MGCGCTRNMQKIKSPEPYNPEERKASKQPSANTHESGDGREFNKQEEIQVKEDREYHTVVWANSPEELKSFQSETTKKIELSGYTITFIFYPVSGVAPTGVPAVIDCFLYVVNDPEADLKMIKKLIEKFGSVWNNKILGPDHPGLSHLKFSIFQNLDHALVDFYRDDEKFSHLVREVFIKIDKDRNHEIDVSEMKNAARLLKINVTDNEIKQTMQDMDLNTDGKISLDEFEYWWKKGRQGAGSFTKVLGKMATKISGSIPGSTEILRQLGIKRKIINKKALKKHMTLQIGPELTNSDHFISLIIGKSAKREQLLALPNSVLEFQKKHTWFSFAFRLQRKPDEASIQKIQEIAQAQLHCVLNSSFDGHKLQNIWDVTVKFYEGTLFIGIWLDLDNELFEEQMKQLSYIEEFWKTPIDDFLRATLKSNSNIVQGDFAENANKGLNLEIEFEVWNKIPELFLHTVKSFKGFMFLLVSGNAKMKTDKIEKLPFAFAWRSFQDLVRLVVQSISNNPLVQKIACDIKDFSIEALDLCVRFNNFGAKLETSKALVQQIIAQ